MEDPAALRVTAQDVASLGCVDEIIAEPEGGIHADPEKGVELLGASIRKHLALLKGMTPEAMLAERQKKFRNIAQFYTETYTESQTSATEPA